MTETTQPKKSDLGVRAASAVVMIAVAGTALWLGGWVWTGFVALVALGVLWEWKTLVSGFENLAAKRAIWMIAGVVYIGLAAAMLLFLRSESFTIWGVATLVLSVIGTDVGAYFVGRTFGGPKIAPAVSPSKTWSGLVGGMLGATLVMYLIFLSHVQQRTESASGEAEFYQHAFLDIGMVPWVGAAIAVIAQIGDFSESWMKRRAGVKDSGRLLPGHGGLFDRLDGLLAASFVSATFLIYASVFL